ncbi:MAG: hypothetical protein N2560_09460 [Ignavibacteria bacterium]|nr:hypothetical protein [Ignavibacteria bacterium]
MTSCGVNDCGCVSFSKLNGRWQGHNPDNENKVELMISLSEKNNNIDGSGNLNLMYKGIRYENVFVCRGSFVSNKLNLEFIGIDSIFYEGILLPTNDTITGYLLVYSTKLSLGLKKLK